MVLYFDSYITDKRLFSWPFIESLQSEVYNGCYSYRNQSRLDIVKYTLASYAVIDWTKVVIKYELEDISLAEEFDRFILDLFPDAVIQHRRSANQKDYESSVHLLEELGDPWVFYAPNNDHVFIGADTGILKSLLEQAEHCREQEKFISVIYSHFTEFLSYCNEKHFAHQRVYPEAYVISENQDSLIVRFPKGLYDSIQIVHIDIMKHWFCSQDFGDRRVIRAEDIKDLVVPVPQTVVVPKQEVCRHYDGYFQTYLGGFSEGYLLKHLKGGNYPITADQVPPLFIPDGFFNKKIRIAYGYDCYRTGWVNINPLKKDYSFRNESGGTDLKFMLSDLPLFWKNRIAEIDTNPVTDTNAMKAGRDAYFEQLRDPWNLSKIRMLSIVIFLRFYDRILPYIKRMVHLCPPLESILKKVVGVRNVWDELRRI